MTVAHQHNDRLTPRLRALCDLDAAFLREYSGLHEEYDGTVIDLSPGGVRDRRDRLGGAAFADPFDEAQVAATENAMRVRFGAVQQHRRDPWVHLEALDLSQYDRPYAPEADRDRARRQHLELWPDVVAGAVESLDLVHPAVAATFLAAVRGVAGSIPDGDPAAPAAIAAAGRFADHLAGLAAQPAEDHQLLGGDLLRSLLGAEDLITAELDALLAMADSEEQRIRTILDDALLRLGATGPAVEAVRALKADHGDFAAVLTETQSAVDAATAFVTERGLIDVVDPDCEVAPAPESRRWGVARVSWRAPWESCGHSYFHVTPPDRSWTPQDADAWLRRFHRAAIPVVAVHEVTPGHCSHARAMAAAPTTVQRTLWSELFFEGWAHYAEEMCWEEGFAADDARYQAGMAMDALLRITRVRCAVGLHTGRMTLDEATELFVRDGFVDGPMARSEAVRGLWEPSFIRYTWGKVLLRRLRDQLRRDWGSDFSLARFHRELLAHGSPPVGLIFRELGVQP